MAGDNNKNETIGIGGPSRRKDGHIGARIVIHTDAHGWHGRYEIDTHGKSSDQAAAEIANRREFHRKRAKILDSLRTIGTESFTVGGDQWRIMGVTVASRGSNVEVFGVAERVGGGDSVKFRRIYPTIDDVPDVGAIRQALRDSAAAVSDLSAQHADFVQKVKTKAGVN